MNDDLLEAYRNSKYVVPELKLTILLNTNPIKVNEHLDGKNGTFCFITAFNPYSELLSNEENLGQNRSLLEDLKDYTIFKGYGQDFKGKWLAEDSFFVMGITKERAIELGNKYKQNAILFGTVIDSNIYPELIILV